MVYLRRQELWRSCSESFQGNPIIPCKKVDRFRLTISVFLAQNNSLKTKTVPSISILLCFIPVMDISQKRNMNMGILHNSYPQEKNFFGLSYFCMQDVKPGCFHVSNTEKENRFSFQGSICFIFRFLFCT